MPVVSLFLSPLFRSFPCTKRSLSLSFFLGEHACRSVPPNLFAREIYSRVVLRKRIPTRDPPRQITHNVPDFYCVAVSHVFFTRADVNRESTVQNSPGKQSYSVK